jgi:fumiquinazoline A oxidase
MSVNLIFFGTQQAAQPFIDQLVALNPLVWRNLSVPWNQLATTAGFGNAVKGACDASRTYTSDFSIGMGQTDQPTYTSFYNNLVEFSKQNPWYRGQFVVERYGTEGPLAVPQRERGVYPWRHVKMQMYVNLFSILQGGEQRRRAIPSSVRHHLINPFLFMLTGYHSLIESTYPNSTFDNTVDAFVVPQRNAFQAKSGFPSLEVYLNYGHGDEGPAVWFGKTNLPRLVTLKQRWDPKGHFGAGNPIPLKWRSCYG